ncbi:MAG: hypothetical protein ABUL66_04305, partial [Verrucomicrobiota bacterium]
DFEARPSALVPRIKTAGTSLGRTKQDLSGSEQLDLEFLGGCEWQATFAVEQFLQPPVAGIALAPDDFRRDKVAHFATITPAFKPVFSTDGAFNRKAGDF